MSSLPKSRSRRRSQPFRRLALLLASAGADAAAVSRAGMALGILGGGAFMATGEFEDAKWLWSAAVLLCLGRLLTIQVAAVLQPRSLPETREEAFYNELPERVSDAITLIGFGFAAGSNAWLGLAAALSAIFSAYIRSFAFSDKQSERSPGIVLMDRRQRLVVLAAAALPALAGEADSLPFPPAEAALWIVVSGCLLTVALRWIGLRAIKL